ncbi:MAG: hypothetical protein V4614_14880 [Pseudomonadota bacterium]
MITLEEYVGPHGRSKDWSEVRKYNAVSLLEACDKLEAYAVADGVEFPENPVTKSGVSGQTFGGFRPQDCPQGAPNSSHKEGQAVDRYDPGNKIDDWCLANLEKLVECGIYIEHPTATVGWSHWTIRAPKSGRRVFYP